MVKRLFSLVVALAIAGAPVALEACQIGCEAASVHPMVAHDTHQAHHHHATNAREARHELPAAPHHVSPYAPPCDHDGEATVASVATARTAFDSVLLHAVAVSPIADVVLAARSTIAAPRQLTLPDRLEIRLARPLRI